MLRLSLVSSPATTPARYSHPFFSLPFILFEAEHRNPNLKLFSYLTTLLTSKFFLLLQKSPIFLYWICPC
ncbi:hypothetical protein Zm00014a_016286 [Zea mays]|uniref:Uncharacterized protein n=1 Tax=Zea mays TaxID=4577 RepID=A0A317YCX3_MAIZE|nr:hypothetical protein Zm00014a_016286 [Zea mays]